MTRTLSRLRPDYQPKRRDQNRSDNQLPANSNFFKRFGIDNYYQVEHSRHKENRPEKHPRSLVKKVTNKYYNYRNINLRRSPLSLKKVVNGYRSEGIEPTVFDLPLNDLLSVIREKKSIRGICLHERIQDPTFRFLARREPTASKEVADTFAVFAQNVKDSFVREGAKTRANASVQKRIEKADVFAENVYPIIENLKVTEGISTYEDTVRMLNEKNVVTPKGGKWHLKTLHAVYKRYEKLHGENKPS